MAQWGYARSTTTSGPSTIEVAAPAAPKSYARKVFYIRRYGWPLYVKWKIAKRLPRKASG